MLWMDCQLPGSRRHEPHGRVALDHLTQRLGMITVGPLDVIIPTRRAAGPGSVSRPARSRDLCGYRVHNIRPGRRETALPGQLQPLRGPPLDSVRSPKSIEQIANPFRPGNGVQPPYLAGRDALLAEFDRFLAESHPPHINWTLTGIRGTGKTVLLGEFASRGERTGWLCLERELSERHRDEDNLVDAVRSDCESLIRRCDALAGVGQAVERGLRFLRPRRVTVGEIGVEPSYEVDPREPAEALCDAFAELDRAVAGTDRPGALLLYDEAHLLADDRRREQYPLSSLLAALGRVQRQALRVRIVLCGLPTLTLNLKRARTYAERMFRHLVIANLERGDAWDALGIPLAGSGRTFGLDLIGDIVEQTDGYPYFLQFFGGFLCSRVATPDIERADLRLLESTLLHELDLAFFEDRYAIAGPAGQRVLAEMARHAGRVSALDLRRALPETQNVDQVVARLLERGLIFRPGRGRYDFALPLFRAYLRRQADLTELSRAR